jgi:hypothetical protein
MNPLHSPREAAARGGKGERTAAIQAATQAAISCHRVGEFCLPSEQSALEFRWHALCFREVEANL